MAGARMPGAEASPAAGTPAPARAEGSSSRGARRWSLGLRAKIVVFFAGLLLVVNLVVLATQRRPIVDVFERTFRIRGEELALNLAAQARNLPRATDGSRYCDLLETFLAFEDVEAAAILRPNGDVLAAAPEEARAPAPPLQPPGAGEVLVLSGDGASDFVASVPGADALARVRLSDRALTGTVKRIGWTITGIAAIAVGVGSLLVFLAASAFTRPIHLLADLARRIRGGELGARLELQQQDEFAELTAAMNEMSVGLAEKDRGLRAAAAAAEAHNEALRRQGREIATQTRNLETLVASISEGVLFLNPERRVEIANHAAERILATPDGGLRGRPLQDVRFPEPDTRLTEILEEACARARQNDRYHSQVRLADHLHTVTTVHDPEGKALGVLAVIQDLSKIRALETEQKELLDQLYQQEKMAIVGLLAASLAHEINTPLGTILLQTQRVARELRDGEEIRALGAVQREVRRCRDIVGRLLDFSRVAEGHPVVQGLAEPVERCVSLAEAGLRLNAISIRKSVASDTPPVRVDANQFEQVVMNLIWNAADAMPQGGCIDIRLRRADGGAELRVRDEGKGISPEHLEKIFEPFFTTKPRGQGTGLGLAICRRIVEEHRGTVEIESEPGSGTEVHVYLPAAERDHG
ncbi:MAG: sensor histidine kinase [Planctomycetota bacterium]|jgi:signal transduction histidine kinase